MTSPARAVRLLVLPLVSPTRLHAQDQACAGVYEAQVSSDMPDSLLCASLLDSFHRVHSPFRPDDFTYQVWDNERQVIANEDVADSQFLSLVKIPSRNDLHA